MMSLSTSQGRMNRWPRRLALLLAFLTFPLIWVGGLVTTTDSGMAVPDWPTTYGFNMFLYPWTTWILGPWDLFIEHGHRLLASLTGMVTVVLVVVVCRQEPRSWMRKLVILALVAVIAQGILGGVRVRLNDVTLAMIHGCTGPAFFVLTAVIALAYTTFWQAPVGDTVTTGYDLMKQLAAPLRLARITTSLVYLQLVLGAMIRHIPVTAKAQTFSVLVVFHIGMAMAVMMHMALLAVSLRKRRESIGNATRGGSILVLLVVAQIFLGVGAWVLQYGWPVSLGENQTFGPGLVVAQGWWQSHIVTGHVAMGSLILVMTALITARLTRLEFWVKQENDQTDEVNTANGLT